MKPLPWHCRHHEFDLAQQSLILGIVNVTPDSFSDGSQFYDPAIAIDRALSLIAEGADIVDIGGESTRPGAAVVSAEEELQRVLPVVEKLAKQTPTPISIDTSKASVAAACLDAGASIINDVTALRDPAMARVVAKANAGCILMHMQGTPQTMQDQPKYDHVVSEVRGYLTERLQFAQEQGIPWENLCIDPGIGFGKTHEHNLELLRNLHDFQLIHRPLCLGVSRKGFMGIITDRPRNERDFATAAIGAYALSQGAAHIFRVHAIGPTRDAIRLWQAIYKQAEEANG